MEVPIQSYYPSHQVLLEKELQCGNKFRFQAQKTKTYTEGARLVWGPRLDLDSIEGRTESSLGHRDGCYDKKQ